MPVDRSYEPSKLTTSSFINLTPLPEQPMYKDAELSNPDAPPSYFEAATCDALQMREVPVCKIRTCTCMYNV